MEEITHAIGRLEKRIDRFEKQGNTRGKVQVCYSCGVLKVTLVASAKTAIGRPGGFLSSRKTSVTPVVRSLTENS